MPIQFLENDITRLDIIIPKEGASVASIVIPADNTVSSSIQLGTVGDITIDTGYRQKFCVATIIPLIGQTKMTLVAGTTPLGMSIVVPEAKNFTNITGRKILVELVETIAGMELGSINENVANFQTAQYQFIQGATVGKQLSKFLQRFTSLGMVWRIDSEGKVEIAQANSAMTSAVQTDNILMDISTNASTIVALQTVSNPFPIPGTMISVPDSGLEDRVYQEFLVGNAGGGTYLNMLVNGTMGSMASVDDLMFETKFNRGYLCQVEEDLGDGTLKLSSSDIEIAGMGLDRIPWKTIAGLTITGIPKGTTCILRFENGHPSRPYVSDFQCNDPNNDMVYKFGTGPNPAALGDRTMQWLNHIKNTFTAFVNAVPTPTDGGAAIQTATATVWNNGLGNLKDVQAKNVFLYPRSQ